MSEKLTDEQLERLAGFAQPGDFEAEENDNYASRKDSPIQGHIIRYNPHPHKNEDGTTSLGFNFPALVASDLLGNAGEVMSSVAEQLNACPALARELLARRRADATPAPQDQQAEAVRRIEALPRYDPDYCDRMGNRSDMSVETEGDYLLRDDVLAVLAHPAAQTEGDRPATPAPADALRLIAQRAQISTGDDAQDALTWIYHTARAALGGRHDD